MRTAAAVTLSISIPLTATSIGFDADVLAFAGAAGTIVGFLLVGASFERVRAVARKVSCGFGSAFTQSLTASSLAFIFGIALALTWPSGASFRLFFGAAAFVSVNWWFHAFAKANIVDLLRENRMLKQELQNARDQIAALVPAGEENDRLRGVVQHVINILTTLERAGEGLMGVNEIGPAAWIEHSCLRSTRDVLARPAGSGANKIELGVLRVPNEVVYVDMAAGDLLQQYQEQGGCPLGRAPDRESIEAILRRKEMEGGFADSMAVEFKLHNEPHYMVALSSTEFDEVDGEMLALIGAMFVVLKLALNA